MLKKSNLIFILVFSFLGYGFGKDFDIRMVLQLAEENNKDIKLARNDLEFARAQKKEAISLALPSINANVNYNRNFLENKLYFTVTDSSGRETTQSFTASSIFIFYFLLLCYLFE